MANSNSRGADLIFSPEHSLLGVYLHNGNGGTSYITMTKGLSEDVYHTQHVQILLTRLLNDCFLQETIKTSSNMLSKKPPTSILRRLIRPSLAQHSQPHDRFQSSSVASSGSNSPSQAKDHDTTIDVTRDEYSKSGGDDAVAEQKIASYHPEDVQPQSSMHTAGKGVVVNPLEMSPANLEASKYPNENNGHPERSAEKTGKSKHGSPTKAKEVDQYEKRGAPPPVRTR